ncbi:helix-turn-helix transcriptional regulator [Streptomyces sp. I05A-00742]|uniref:ArsR/SmtB family transcription factor n=1 Tax=Streptomyces sp. I05A-00742 TaxID=2732853 RepID=UPI001487B74A|nr:metalloregulator ArsR/SmtB family transcription factor [Streptomyces sp. I05A-00742]
MRRSNQEARLPQPDLAAVEIGTVLQALADPVRLQIVRLLSRLGHAPCGGLDVPVKRSTVSHHLRTLRESGLVETHLQGNTRISAVRREELDRRFPGLLASILDAAPAVTSGPEGTAASGESGAGEEGGSGGGR